MPVGSQSPHYVANFRVLFAHVDGVHCVWPSKVDSRLPVRNGRPVERFYLYYMIFIALLCLMARYWNDPDCRGVVHLKAPPQPPTA